MDIDVSKTTDGKYVRLVSKGFELELPVQLARSLRTALEAVLSGRRHGTVKATDDKKGFLKTAEERTASISRHNMAPPSQ